MEDDSPEIPCSLVKKKKTRKHKVQDFLVGRSRRRINSESSSTLSETRAAFVRSSSVSVRANLQNVESTDEDKCEDDKLEELDFLEMLGKLQSSRLDDQRTALPPALVQIIHQICNLTSMGRKKGVTAVPVLVFDLVVGTRVEEKDDTGSKYEGCYGRLLQTEISEDGETAKLKQGTSKDEDDSMQPIQQVLALGAPYPLVVLPVEGDYWMEGTNHILQRDTHNRPMIPVVDLSRCIVESDHTASAYRENFLGKEHLNYAAVDNRHGPMVLSVRCEFNDDGDGSFNDSRDYYEVMLRLKDRTIHQFIPSASLSENPRPREIIQSIIQDELDIDRFHPIAIPRITEHIVKYDEHILTNCYKVGVIYQKFGQTTEEEYFGNQTHSSGMEEFLNCIATKVRLQGFKGYRGGLDVKHDQTGEYSFHTVFREREFMFHVSTQLPYKPEDRQQVQRKRHIGNDIVTIVFQDENTPFSPTSVRSHFLHTFIIVQVIDANTPNVRYKISVTARDGVPHFGPALPNPAVFRKGKEFREFLMTKILNAEIAACKSEKFSQLAERTRAMLLQQLVTDLIVRNEQYMEDGALTRSYSGGKGSILSSFRSALANSKARNGSSYSLNSNLSVQGQKNGISLSLNDINDGTAEDPKKEKKKLFSRNRHSRDQTNEHHERKESKSSTVSPTSPSNSTWPNNSLSSVNGDKGDFFGFRSKSVEQAPTSPSVRVNHRPYGSCSCANSSPSFSSNRRTFHGQEMSNKLDSNLTVDPRYTRDARSSSFNDADSLRLSDQRGQRSHYISVSSCSSYEDISSSSACSALDAAQREIDSLRSEVSKLKSDKMDLVRQNVAHQREIRKYKEKSLQQTAQLYAAQHELTRFRMMQVTEDVNHNDQTANHETELNDGEMTPINQKSNEQRFFNHEFTPTKPRSMSYANRSLKGKMSIASAVSHHEHKLLPSKRHSISHV